MITGIRSRTVPDGRRTPRALGPPQAVAEIAVDRHRSYDHHAPTSAALRHLTRLRDKGYVTIGMHETDARKRLVQLSALGLARIEHLLAPMGQLFTGLDREQAAG